GRNSGVTWKCRRLVTQMPVTVRRKLYSTLNRLGLEKGRLHAFRHCRVSILQERGIPRRSHQGCIGHSILRTTSRYTHFGDEYRQQIATELGLFSAVIGPRGPELS